MISLAFIAAVLCEPAQAGTVQGRVSHGSVSADLVVSIDVVGVKLEAPKKHAVLNQKNMTFEPHVLAIQRGTTVDFYNSDPVNHNVFSPDGETYNLGTWSRGTTRTHTFDNAGVYVQLCSLHPEMEGFVVVLDTPFFAVTDSDGHYEIEGVPAGQHVVHVWGSSLSRRDLKRTFEVKVEGETTTLDLVW